MPEVILSLNASKYNKDLSASMEMTEAKAKETAAAVEKAAASASTAGVNAAKKIAKEGEKSGNSLKESFKKWKETFTDGKAFEQFAGPLAAIELIKKGIELCITMAKDLWDSWTQSAEELEKIAEAQKDILNTETQLNEKRLSETMNYLDKLKALSAQEKLSNDQRREMIQIIDILNGRYKGLNLSVEMLTGSMVQFEKAQAKILRHEAAKKKHLLGQERGLLLSENNAQAEIAFDNMADMNTSFFQKYTKTGIDARKILSGKAYTSHDDHLVVLKELLSRATKKEEVDAIKKIIQNVTRIQAIDKEFASLHFTGYSSEAEDADAASQRNMFYHNENLSLDQRQSAAANAEAQLKEQQALAKMTPAQKIQYYKKKLSASQKQYNDILPGYKQALDQWDWAKAYGSQAQQLDARKTLVPLEEKRVQLLQEQYRYLDMIAHIEKEIAEAAATAAAVEAKKKEDDEKAAKAKQLRSARQGILGKAQSLMDKTLSPKESAYASTLRDFEAKKGESATDQEKDLIRKLADLTVSIGEKTDMKFSEIQTNSLTARGGFQSGAVVSDKDAINRQIEKNTQREAAQSAEIKDLVKKIKESLDL